MTKLEFIKAAGKSLFVLPIWALDGAIKILVAWVWIDIFGQWSILSVVATLITYYLMDVPPSHQDWVYNKINKFATDFRSRYGCRD